MKKLKVLIKNDPEARWAAHLEYLRSCEDEHNRQRTLHDYATDIEAAYQKGFAEGKAKAKLERLVNAILITLKTILKKKVPQRIANALKTQTDPAALESLLIKAASCKSLEEFENELK